MSDAPAPMAPAPKLHTFTFAGIGKRFLALLLDGLIIGLITAPFSYSTGLHDFSSNTSMFFVTSAFSSFLSFLVNLAYHTFFIGQYGQTPGKMALKIKVLMEDGSHPTFPTAVIRYLVSLASGAVFVIGYIWAFFNPKKQTWHDLAAHTYVVNVE